MATKVLSSSNNVQKTTMSDKSAFQKPRYELSELRRLSTFNSKDNDMHPTVTKGLLAKIGFFHTGQGNKIKCEACDFEVESSTSASDLIEKHMNQTPQCRFILSNSEFYSKNNQTNPFSILNTSQTGSAISNCQSTTIHLLNDNENNSIPQKLFLSSLPDTTIDKLRESTFSNWPLITPNAKDMIIAGWAFTNIADRVICIYCDVLYHKWTESDRPYEIHRLKSPQCPFILAAEKKAALANRSNITITTEPNIRAAVDVVNTTYSLSTRRYESFRNWPHTEQNPLPSIESFVNAGFYYTGDSKVVRCFYCDGALKNWESTDDPKVEHARWYPHCAYIRQYIGEDLYEAIQRKNRELKAQQNDQQNSTTKNSEASPWTQDEIDRMVKARLDLTIVEKLRQAGFSMAIIRKTFEMQLKFKKDDFKTDYDLQIACLILDQQVKLINGNEANLLVPQDWMKKYIEDEERGIHQSKSQPVQTQIKSIEIPQVIAPVVVRPRIAQKLDEESMPCVLCLTTERQVACLPCGHLTTCVACGHSLKTCPICRATVKAFVRIYV